MVYETNEIDWVNKLCLKNLSIFFQPDYLNCIASAFNLKIRYFLNSDKSKINAGVAVFEKNYRAVTPEQFTYTPLWISEDINERNYLAVVSQIIAYLKNKYAKLTFKLDTSIIDVRPFIWRNFEAHIRYTYIKKTSEPPDLSISKNLRKKPTSAYTCEAHFPDDQSIQINLDFLQQLGYSNAKCKNYKYLLESWSANGYLQAFTTKIDDKLLGSSLVLLDKNKSKAYTILSNPIIRSEKYVHTLLYQFRIDWLHENGYAEVDLCGADIKGISNFKSFFNPALKPHFHVFYSPLKSRLKPFWDVLKHF